MSVEWEYGSLIQWLRVEGLFVTPQALADLGVIKELERGSRYLAPIDLRSIPCLLEVDAEMRLLGDHCHWGGYPYIDDHYLDEWDGYDWIPGSTWEAELESSGQDYEVWFGFERYPR